MLRILPIFIHLMHEWLRAHELAAMAKNGLDASKKLKYLALDTAPGKNTQVLMQEVQHTHELVTTSYALVEELSRAVSSMCLPAPPSRLPLGLQHTPNLCTTQRPRAT